jgi:hypothetical protein
LFPTSSGRATLRTKEDLISAKQFLKRENVISISTPFKKSSYKDIDVHREEVSYIVSEEFFKQFTALAFIDFKKISPNNYPACRVCHEDSDSLQKL